MLAAPVSAEFHPSAGILSIDLSNAVPEIAADLAKADLGTITVSVTRGGTTTELGSIAPAAYARSAYEARGGIVDMSVSGAGVDGADPRRRARVACRRQRQPWPIGN